MRQAVDVGLPGAEVAAFHRIIKQAEDAVIIVLIVLSGIDAPLGGDAVCPAGGILDAEGLHLVAQFRQGGGGRSAGQAGTHYQDLKLALVSRTDDLNVVLMAVPFLLDGPIRYFAV